MKKVVAVFGTMDTKGAEYFFLKEQLERNGVETLMIDTGISPQTAFPCQISCEEVARAGGGTLADIGRHERNFAFELMGSGSAAIVRRLCNEGKIDGAISLGGGQGTLLAAMVMRELPIGFPKMIVSTIVNLRTPPFEGVKDTVVMNSLVDVCGLNRVLRMVLRTAAASMAGMVLFERQDDCADAKKKVVGMSMFGVTTPCVNHVRDILEANGYEVIVFHANGMGGKRLEEMVRSGTIGAVADITTGEVGQEYVGGNCTAGPHRMEAAAETGAPQIVVPGAMDLANFMPPSSLPTKYAGRAGYMHNPNLFLMRTNAEECSVIGRILAEKVNRSTGPVEVILPKKGISQYSSPCGPLVDRAADKALFTALQENLRKDIPVIECDLAINDPQFAEIVAQEMMKIY